jgi:dihydrodipicolinate synthase/N-acetylneuraminate lyase
VAIVASNTPGYTSGISIETANALLKTGRFAGIEDAGAELEFFAHLPRSALFAASDSGIARVRPAAILSSVACAFPELVLALDRAIAADDAKQIAQLDAIFQQFSAWTARFPLPAVLKSALRVRGLKTGPFAVPLSPASEQELDRFREWFAAILANFGREPLHG